MFTLGDKQRVLNADADVKVYDAVTGAERTTAASITATDQVRVSGYADFLVSDLAAMKLRRSVPSSLDSKDYTVVAPAGLAVGDAVEVLINFKTSRYEGELKNNYIGGGRPVIFQTAALGTLTPTAIATAIVAGYTSYKDLFNMADLALDVVAGAAATDIQVSANAPYPSITIESVELKRVAQGIASPTPVALAVSVTNSTANEGAGLGKFLEESVRMSTPGNSDPYGVDNADSRVDLRGAYTSIYMEVASVRDENLSTLAPDHGPLNGKHSLTLWANEATMLAANGAINKLASIAVLAAGLLANVTVTVIAAPLTVAQEETEALILADSSSVATAAAFIV